MTDEAFTKIVSGFLTHTRDLIGWGIEGGHTTQEKLRLTVQARKEAALKLIEAGESKRGAAKALGVSEGTIRNDVRTDSAKNAKKLRSLERNERISTANKDLPTDKYAVIYADPPWSFQAWSGEGTDRTAENHYPTMAQAEIEAMPVQQLAADNCALFLWAVMPQLPEALKVINAWGFEYKTCAFAWFKQTKDEEKFTTGMGYWTRANAEICLLATKGSPKRKNAGVHQVIAHPQLKHSKKPDEVRRRIELLLDGPYIELFARNRVDGWDVWGNQADVA